MAKLNVSVFKNVLEDYKDVKESYSIKNCTSKTRAVKNFNETWPVSADNFWDIFLNKVEPGLKERENVFWYDNLQIEQMKRIPSQKAFDIFNNLFAKAEKPDFESLESFYDNDRDHVLSRIDTFKDSLKELTDIKCPEWVATTFLWLYFPNDYYACSNYQMQFIMEILDEEYNEKTKYSYEDFVDLHEQMRSYIQEDPNFKKFLENYHDEIGKDSECYNDPVYITLVNDIGNYVYKQCRDKKEKVDKWKNTEANNSTSIENKPVKGVNDTIEAISKIIKNGGTQVILTGAPGTGKTYAAREVAERFGSELSWLKSKPKYMQVQFHPSYDYTDFMEGLRPVETENEKGKSEITFKKIDGSFKRFCREVVNADKPDGKYFFLIDEINRADLSKVFGEVMFGLERGKRGKGYSIETQYQNLSTFIPDKNVSKEENKDCFSEGFYIPENVIIIGTMNDIDRSVESMDFALRRRFIWYDVKVDETMLTRAMTEILATYLGTETGKNAVEKIVKRITNLNTYIGGYGREYGLNHNYDISQGQFTDFSDDIYLLLKEGDEENITEFMQQVWNQRVEGLLKEYVRGEEIGDFIDVCRGIFVDGNNPPSDDEQE